MKTMYTIPILDVNTFYNAANFKAIDDDLILFDNVSNLQLTNFPVRLDGIVLAICLNGNCRLGINLENCNLSSNQLLIVMPEVILQCLEVSSDFSGNYIFASQVFLDTILPRLKEILPLFLYIKEHPCLSLNTRELNIVTEYYSLLSDKTSEKDNHFRKEVTQGILLSLFYDLYNICIPSLNDDTIIKNRSVEIFDKFLTLLTQQFKKERSVIYYSNKLYLTPKYLSWVVKEVSGKTAGEWIDSFVILEAKTLLKSADMNIQQIAEELNFANQSFFGKYFKHYTGLSPKEYKKK